eukprot:gnl/MRDRNA2_/MRDRNA2_89326_c0_seq1.p1 gnl/MRDRNA2_/MRDRNA2_89326_c0~~gnl/MRDRNA2_/MRDRNA2_89326_c0_seq1.p1  ORF type:complete len:539 (-),score=185.96 gnl/MRDRNA2_/MRDRNA2_89326_c0_seq1:226-1842(-)
MTAESRSATPDPEQTKMMPAVEGSVQPTKPPGPKPNTPNGRGATPRGKQAPSASSSVEAPAVVETEGGTTVDIDRWHNDLQGMHLQLNSVLQNFVANQSRHIGTVAAELDKQREQMVAKERHTVELSNAIASFVEEEAKKLLIWGVPLDLDSTDDLIEAYDQELPGAQSLHRINRMWRKATKAFEAAREVKEKEMAAALDQQRQEHSEELGKIEKQRESDKKEHAAVVAALETRVEELLDQGIQKDSANAVKTKEIEGLAQKLAEANAEIQRQIERVNEGQGVCSRKEYEFEAERDELVRERTEMQSKIKDLEGGIADGVVREEALQEKIKEMSSQLVKMKKDMDDQEQALLTKMDRVQQYVKERQASAMQAEKKLQDAELLAERWQEEVRRLQADQTKLQKAVLDTETRSGGQAHDLQGQLKFKEHENERLREAMREQEKQMRLQQQELLKQREQEYTSKVSLEKEKERDRSMAQLKKKEQEVQIKDQQLKAAKARIQELEAFGGMGAGGASPRRTKEHFYDQHLPSISSGRGHDLK